MSFLICTVEILNNTGLCIVRVSCVLDRIAHFRQELNCQ